MKKYIGIKTGISHSNLTSMDMEKKETYTLLEERLSRNKNIGGFPATSAKWLILKNKNLIKLPNKRFATNSCTNHPVSFEKKSYAYSALKFMKSLSCLENSEMHYPSHHYAHCMSAIGQSPFQDCYILVCDGVGSKGVDLTEKLHNIPDNENETLSLYHYTGELELIYKESSKHAVIVKNGLEYPLNEGIGSLYMNAANYIFGDWQNSGKVMGLSTFGKKPYHTEMTDFELNNHLINLAPNKSLGQVKFNNLKQEDRDHLADVALEVQVRLERKITVLLKKYISSSDKLIFTGGVALNCILNTKLGEKYTLWNPPNPGDFGISIGCATSLAIQEHSLSDVKECLAASPFLGRDFKISDIRKVFSKEKIEETNLVQIAQLLNDGEIIAWVQGRSEIGPRALGNRSLLAAPHLSKQKKYLNEKVKFREAFRPYGASILKEKVQSYFDVTKGFESPFMNKIALLKESKSLEDISHIDKTCRLQTVDKIKQPIFYNLIKEFEKISSYPILLNTSLNIMGCPIVDDLDDLLKFFNKSCIKYIYVENFLITKSQE